MVISKVQHFRKLQFNGKESNINNQSMAILVSLLSLKMKFPFSCFHKSKLVHECLQF